jgi:hypothetical protein
MSAEILPFVPRFDPTAPGAERRYDGVVARINRVSARRRGLRRTSAELERQFVENDLVSRSGARRGRPLTSRGRRQRLDALLATRAELEALDREWEHLHAELERMNRALDAWAREHWGMGSGS